MNIRFKKILLRFWWLWLILIITFIFIGFSSYGSWKERQFVKSKNDIFITAMPMDLMQITQVSFFRSCMGHDYSGLNLNGEKEIKRSMKHYVQPLSQFNDTSDKVSLYAPFDGKIANIAKGKDSLKSQDPRFGGWGVDIYPTAAPAWTMEFGHVYTLPELEVGSTIKSGELIGYAYVQPDGSSFDLALWTDKYFSRQFSDDGTATLDSIFNHMTRDVLLQLQEYDFTKDDFIISKEFRDANLCQEESRGINAAGENEIVFTSTPGDVGYTVEINYDPNIIKKNGADIKKE